MFTRLGRSSGCGTVRLGQLRPVACQLRLSLGSGTDLGVMAGRVRRVPAQVLVPALTATLRPRHGGDERLAGSINPGLASIQGPFGKVMTAGLPGCTVPGSVDHRGMARSRGSVCARATVRRPGTSGPDTA